MEGDTVGAFELIPAIEPSLLPNGEKISTIELSGSDTLYIGTNNGLILDYKLHSRNLGRENASSAQLRRVKELNPRLNNSPVTFLRSASALDRLLVLCDSTLTVLNASDLSPLSSFAGASKLKGVGACCVNENSTNNDPFSVQLCLAKKKQLAVISISEVQIKVDKIKDVSEPVKAVGMDGNYICAALNAHYIIFDIGTGSCQDLFPFEDGQIPIVTRIAKEEFLLCAPGGLGMFVTSSTGISERPPIQWMQGSSFCSVQKCIYYDPYVIALTSSDAVSEENTGDSIIVYSVSDQKSKQTLPFFGGNVVGNYDGSLLVSSAKSVYRIQPISAQIQIESLLANNLIEEALSLAERSEAKLRSRSTMKENSQENSENRLLEDTINRTYQMAGFNYMKHMDLMRAKSILEKGCIDPRELICLWPRLLPSSSSFTRSITPRPLHGIADINQLSTTVPTYQGHATGGINKYENLEKLSCFLTDVLEDQRSREGERCMFKCEIDTALIKLYSKDNPAKLVTFLNGGGNVGGWSDLAADYDDCSSYLETNERIHALALLNWRMDKENQAFQIWSDLLNEKRDPGFPGIDFFVSRLMCSSEEMLWRYANLVLTKDQKLGAKLFIQFYNTKDMKCEENEQTDLADKIISFLKPQHSMAGLLFLEHIIIDKKLNIEKYHTQLALAYLDEIRKSDVASCEITKTETDKDSKSIFYEAPHTEVEAKSNSQFYVSPNIPHNELLKTELRKKFQNLIISSSLLNARFLLSILEKDFSHFHQEKAFLLGRMGDHTKALKIFIHDLKDFTAAEEYCDKIVDSSKSEVTNKKDDVIISNQQKTFKHSQKEHVSDITPSKTNSKLNKGTSSTSRSRLLKILLRVYLDKSLAKEQQEELELPALDLLQRRAKEMDAVDILSIIPDHWSIAALLPALNLMMRSKIHDRRMSSVKRHLAEAENIDMQYEELQLVERPIFVLENTYCMVCKKNFRSPRISRYPNGVVIHPECIKDDSICPITGQIFKMDYTT